MHKEIEAKFLKINIDEMRSQLRSCGATLQIPMRMMRRIMVKTPAMYENDSFLRVRDEGDKITMTYKQFDAPTVDGCNELEVVVSDFEKTIEMLKYLGLPPSTYQESRRETWQLDDVEIMIDEWPWIEPYVEIEGKEETALKLVAQKLGFEWKNAKFGSTMRAYEDAYPLLLKTGLYISEIPRVTFDAPVPDVLTTEGATL